MTPTLRRAPILVLNPDPQESHQIAEWLRAAGLGLISTARTANEAIFMLGRSQPSLLVLDERVPGPDEDRLLRHLQMIEGQEDPVLVRLLDERSPAPLALGRPLATEVIRKPLTAHDVVLRIGSAMDRPDLLGRLDASRDQTLQNLQAARQMQIGLLPNRDQLRQLQESCGVGVAALYRAGEAVGGDFWGVWPTGRGRLALSIVDFVGHGLSAALNTFRFHALLSDQTLPRGNPARMTALLNERLHLLLPRGQYASMVYLLIDAARQAIVWSGAGAPEPLFVSSGHVTDLNTRGLPLGIRSDTKYRSHRMRTPESGILAVFSDGLFESGANDADVPREAMAEALAEPARMAARGHLTAAARDATARLERLRDQYPCRNHSDDVMAICVAFGPNRPLSSHRPAAD